MIILVNNPVFTCFEMSKKRQITFVKKDWCLVPAFSKDKEQFDKMKNGELFKAPFSKARNARFLAKYWVLLDLVYNNLPDSFTLNSADGQILHIRNVEDINWHVKMQLGIYERRVTLGGKVMFEAGSISFAAMDEDQFQEFYDNAINVVIKHFLTGTEKEELEKQVLENFA